MKKFFSLALVAFFLTAAPVYAQDWDDNDDWSDNTTSAVASTSNDGWSDNTTTSDNWSDNSASDSWNDNTAVSDNWNDNDDWNDNTNSTRENKPLTASDKKTLGFFYGGSAIVALIAFISYKIASKRKKNAKGDKGAKNEKEDDGDNNDDSAVEKTVDPIAKPQSLTTRVSRPNATTTGFGAAGLTQVPITAQYKVIVKGVTHGPYTLAQMQQFIAQGRMNRNTQVIVQGLNGIHAAGSLSTLEPLLTSAGF